jgi:signal transduction histidine kinase
MPSAGDPPKVDVTSQMNGSQDVIDAFPALFMALDGNGRIALWNRRLEEVTGFDRTSMIGQPGREMIQGPGPRPLAVKDGGRRLVRWECSGSDDATPPALTLAVGTDVTDEHEARLRATRADRLSAVGTLAAGLAHEVRNPLNAALLQLTVLRRRLDRPDCQPATVQPVAAVIEQELQRLDRLVDDFIAFAQPRALHLRPTDLASLCRTVGAALTPDAERGGVRLAFDLPERTPVLLADPDRLQHVLINLARNALDAMPGGGELSLRLRPVRDAVEIDVADTGPGFPEDTPVFDAFFTTKANGTGLGLSIVHRIVTDHGGTVSVRSQPGSTCFTISLPMSAG